MNDDPLLRLTDAIDALTKPRTHREPYTVLTGAATSIQRHHVTHVASLLEQLGEIAMTGASDAGHRVPSSTPPARLEAIDTVLLIEVEASQWVSLLRLTERYELKDSLRSLLGGMTAMEADDGNRNKLAKNAARWVTMAEVTTGWDVEPWKPYITCPICSELGTLRIRVGSGFAAAMCVSCRSDWDWSTIGLLAEHIRAESGDDALYGEEEKTA